MHFAESPRAGEASTDPPDPTAVVLLLQAIFGLLREIRAQLDGRLKSHLTVEEIAGITGRAPYTVRRWVTDGRIKADRVTGTGPRGRLLIPRSELDKLIAAGLAGECDFLTAKTTQGSGDGQ